ncbi:molecular chaperone [Salmonella enterica]|nr:molecular chaperone [Salmonella enterica]ECT6519216.1 molecular chaperone [Salmonella enterica]EDX8941804.1 molecular chaperone [Salmonella enterica subsp. enterica serovar Aba]EIY0670639.1 molecular chaperone TorD family protein [Salmonella enterica]
MTSVYKTLTDPELSGLLLRDFFNTDSSASLMSAYSALNPRQAPTLTEQEWLGIEYDFNALFIGPQKLKAAPFASVYLEEEALVMGRTTLDIREFMASVGLYVNKENIIPDDHISYVLELAVLLSANARQTAEYEEVLRQYVLTYLTQWVPLFIEKIKINARTAALRAVAEKLAFWLDELKTGVSI